MKNAQNSLFVWEAALVSRFALVFGSAAAGFRGAMLTELVRCLDGSALALEVEYKTDDLVPDADRR